MLAVVSDIPLSFVSPAKLLMVHSVKLGGEGKINKLNPKKPETTNPSMFLVHEIVSYRSVFTVLH